MTFALRILQKTDQIMRKEKLEKRADGNLLYRCSYKLVRAKPFNHLISVCILVNTVTLAMDCHPMDVLQEQIIEYTNILFYFVFLLEMIFKLIGLGFGEYTRLRSNIFDMAIVILSTFDFIFFVLSAFTEVNFEKVSSIALVFRIFRTLRILKLANTWPRLSFFLKTMLDTINSVGSFGILLSIFIFMYAILGMELLSYSLKMTRLDKPVDYFATGNPEVSDVYSVPDSNFDGFVNATLSVFIVLANDGWTDVFFDYYRTVGGGMSSIFFISLVVLGQMILLNLFLSMMLEKFDDDKFERES